MGKVYSYDVVTSTNDVAKEMLPLLNNGDVIWALLQTQGRGKGDRKWYSPEGGLWFSVVYKPQIVPHDLNVYTKLASVSVVKTLQKLGVDEIGVKWPNDIYHARKKVGGILTEICTHDNNTAVIVGVGLNVNNDLPQNVENATSLFEITGERFSIAQLLNMITHRMEKFYNFITSGHHNVITNLWRNSMVIKKGNTVKIHDFSGEIREAKVIKVLSDSLIVEIDGVKERVYPSEISF